MPKKASQQNSIVGTRLHLAFADEGRFVVDTKDKLGSGSFGSVVRGTDSETNAEVAVKIEKAAASETSARTGLLHEAEVYAMIQERVPAPRMLWFGADTTDRYRALVLEHAGPNVEDVFLLVNRYRPATRRFLSVRSLCVVAIRMLQALRDLHAMGMVHCDIKPQNWLFSLDPRANSLLLIDFGLTRPYIDPRTGKHLLCTEKKDSHGSPVLIGTPRYCSLNAHLGRTLARRDDLESVCYVLRFLAKGTLPWWTVEARDAREGHELIRKKKKHSHPRALFEGFPPIFAGMLQYARDLPFSASPDYGAWITALHGVLERETGTDVEDYSHVRCDWWLSDSVRTHLAEEERARAAAKAAAGKRSLMLQP